METWGTGIKRIEKICKDKNVKFDFNEKGSFVTLVFHRKKKLLLTEKRQKSIENVSNKYRISTELNLTLQEKKVIELAENKKKLTTANIQNLFSIKEARARRILSNLAKKGLLTKIGTTKGSYYIIKKAE